MDKVTWPAAAVVISILLTIFGLVWIGQDLTAVSVVIAGLLGWNAVQLGATKENVSEVKTQTNGNNQKLVDALLARDAERDKLVNQLLLALPPETKIPAAHQLPFDPDATIREKP